MELTDSYSDNTQPFFMDWLGLFALKKLLSNLSDNRWVNNRLEEML